MATEKTVEGFIVYVLAVRNPFAVAKGIENRSITPEKGAGFHRPVSPIGKH
jgi:hypothetical protein